MIEVKQPPDPWQRTTTEHGFPADEVISALQKSIRRALVENALLLGWEMYVTSPEMEEMLWSRLCVIAVEDVGYGNLDAPVLAVVSVPFLLAAGILSPLVFRAAMVTLAYDRDANVAATVAVGVVTALGLIVSVKWLWTLLLEHRTRRARIEPVAFRSRVGR